MREIVRPGRPGRRPFLPPPRGRELSGSARAQLVFVGEDHHLDPVPELQLGQDARDVGLDGGLGGVEALGDLGVLGPVAMTARGFCPWLTAR